MFEDLIFFYCYIFFGAMIFESHITIFFCLEILHKSFKVLFVKILSNYILLNRTIDIILGFN